VLQGTEESHVNRYALGACLTNYGIIMHYFRGNLTAAELLYREAITLNASNIYSLVHYGVLLATELNQPDEAERLYKRALAVDPVYVPGIYHYANLLTSKAEDDRAEELYKQAMRLEPNNLQMMCTYGIFQSTVRL